MSGSRSLEEAPEAFGDVALDATQSDSMAKHTAATLFDSTCGVEEAVALDLLQDRQELTGADCRDGPGAETGEDMSFQETPISFDRLGSQAALVGSNLKDLEPGSCDGFKRVGVRSAPLAALSAGVDAAGEDAARIGVEASRLRETDFGIGP
jgi:hypothetical protein